MLPIFPEGKVTPASGEFLGEMRPGAAFIAIRAGVPVIPAFIRGTPPTDQIGESLVTPSRSRVTFGQPIDLSRFNRHQAGDKDVQAEVSRLFRQALLELRDHGFAGRTRGEDGGDATHSAQRHPRCGMIRFRSFSHAIPRHAQPLHSVTCKCWEVSAGTAAALLWRYQAPMGHDRRSRLARQCTEPRTCVDHSPLADGGR